MLCGSNWYKSSKLSPKVWVHTRTSTSTNQVLQVYCSANVNSIVHRHSLEDLLHHPPAQSRITNEVRLGWSGLYPGKSWKSPRVETAQLFWAACSIVWLSFWWKTFLFVSGWNLLCQFMTIACQPLIMHVHEWLCFPSNFPIGIGKLPLGCPKALTSLG